MSSKSTRSEQALLDAARTGDREALEGLLEQVAPMVHRFGLRMCNSPEDAEDVLQETLLSAMRGLPGFRGEAAFSTWLFSVARSHCIKVHRRSKFAPPALEPYDENGGAPPSDSLLLHAPLNPETEAARKEFETQLERGIASLEPEQREVLLLRDVEGLPLKEVARVVESSLTATKSRLHRARARLRSFLENEAPEPMGAAKTRDSGCPDVAHLFSRFIEQEIGPAECAAMKAHVDNCDSCSAVCRSLERALGQCRAVPGEPLPQHTQQVIQAALERVVRMS